MCAAAKPPTISAVLTVYNKAPHLPDTIRSLRRQAADEHDVEYIFVDDASTDESVAVIRSATAGAPHVRIIGNADNRGPSVRLNQGATAAAGEFLYFLDGDDIAIQGAMSGMVRLLREHQADVVYGKTAKRLDSGVDPLDLAVDPDAPVEVSDTPLKTVLGGGFVRMALMCRRRVFLHAGGADMRVFVQDETLPLRLAVKAARFVHWRTEVIAMPLPSAGGASKLSGNKAQLHHDAFLAYRHALEDFADDFPDLAPKLYARAVSAYWKHARRQPGTAMLKPGFWRYLQTRIGEPAPRRDVLAWMAAELAAVPGVRRM